VSDSAAAWAARTAASVKSGRSWSSPVKIDDASAGDGNPGHINANGFDEIYGDYGEIAVASAGRRSRPGARA
jgi:hypothetical protein